MKSKKNKHMMKKLHTKEYQSLISLALWNKWYAEWLDSLSKTDKIKYTDDWRNDIEINESDQIYYQWLIENKFDELPDDCSNATLMADLKDLHENNWDEFADLIVKSPFGIAMRHLIDHFDNGDSNLESCLNFHSILYDIVKHLIKKYELEVLE